MEFNDNIERSPMNKKSKFNTGSNLCFLILTSFAFISMLQQISNAFATIKGLNTEFTIKFTIIKLIISANSAGFNHIYIIYYQIAIPIIVGILYNIYYMIRFKKQRKNVL
jgi:hypothetical protein